MSRGATPCRRPDAGNKPRSMSQKRHVVVLGGGISGMAAACELLDHGCAVTLIERRPYLGGRAFSFTDPATGSVVDNGQHVFLGCCLEYIRFLTKLGTLHKTYFQTSPHLRVLGAKGKLGHLRAWPLPAPFHMLPSFLTYPHLSWWDKLLALYGLAHISLTDRRRPSLDSISFYQWLKSHHQTERAIERFWDLIALPVLNDRAQDASAAMGVMAFQEGLLKGRHGANVGYARVGLSQLMGEAAAQYIRDRAGTLMLGRPMTRILTTEEVVSGIEMANQDIVRGDAYLSALPYDVLARTLPKAVLEQGSLGGITALSSSPIVNVHIWYDRPVMEGDFLAVLDSPLQWVFNKSLILLEEGGDCQEGPPRGQYVSLSVSGAWEYIRQPKRELEMHFLTAMAQAFPAAADARVEKVIIVKQEQATFRCLPGVATLRPGVDTPLDNLFLAGEWTDTGWPSTMEGAVRSGLRAAHAVVNRG